MPKILILGDGKLATEIVKQTKWPSISRKDNNFDFCKLETYAGYLKTYDCILNAIGYTNTYDPDRKQHWNVNYKATCDLIDWCQAFNKKLIHISTDYVYADSVENATENDIPLASHNWYGYTKLLSDAYIQMRMNNYLLIRTSFKDRPFPWIRAITTQVGNFDYIDTIAELIIRLIKGGATGVYNVGTEIKTVYDLALKTKPEVISCDLLVNQTQPTNVTMNVSKMNDFLGIKQ